MTCLLTKTRHLKHCDFVTKLPCTVLWECEKRKPTAHSIITAAESTQTWHANLLLYPRCTNAHTTITFDFAKTEVH